MRSKAAKEVLASQMDTSLTDLAGKVTRLETGSGKFKLPKRKKVLTEEQELERQLIATKKKPPAYAFKNHACKHAVKIKLICYI